MQHKLPTETQRSHITVHAADASQFTQTLAEDIALLWNLHTNDELVATARANGYREDAKYVVHVEFKREIPEGPNTSSARVLTHIGWLKMTKGGEE